MRIPVRALCCCPFPAGQAVRAVCLILVAIGATGCGYFIGSPYSPEIRTISVPTFESDGYRRGLEMQLTEAVHREIKTLTHFELVKGQADTQLTGRIVRLEKRVLGQTGFDDPRELRVDLAVDVTWVDTRTGELLLQQQFPLEPEIVQIRTTGTFAPEVGQSLATGYQSALDQMARRIVQMMEMPF